MNKPGVQIESFLINDKPLDRIFDDRVKFTIKNDSMRKSINHDEGYEMVSDDELFIIKQTKKKELDKFYVSNISRKKKTLELLTIFEETEYQGRSEQSDEERLLAALKEINIERKKNISSLQKRIVKLVSSQPFEENWEIVENLIYEEYLKYGPDMFGDACMYAINYNAANSFVLAGIARLLSQYDSEEFESIAPSLFVPLASHTDRLVREYAMILFDNWRTQNLIEWFNNINLDEPWMLKYKELIESSL